MESQFFDANEGYDENTSTNSNSFLNTGESSPQDGDQIVNEQEQTKPVNAEEFIDTAPQIIHNESPKGPSSEKELAKQDAEKEDEPEVGDDPDTTKKKIPTMNE